MQLPMELAPPPPRDPAAAARFFARGRKAIAGAILSAFVLPALFVGISWIRFRGLDHPLVDFAIASVLSVLALLFAFAAWVQQGRARRLYRDGAVTIGRIVGVKRSAGDSYGNSLVWVEVEFADARGARHRGRLSTSARVAQIDTREGVEVAVVFLPEDPTRFAMFSPSLGLMPGLAKPA